MAESKLTDQPVLTTAAAGDYVYVVDVSDTSGGAAGTSKKATITTLMGQAPVVSVNGETGAVSLDSTEIKRIGTTGDSVDQDLTAAETSINEIKAVLKYPAATVTGLQVDASNKLEIDSTNQKAIFTINGTTSATVGPTQSLFPALRIGTTGNTYDLPTSRGLNNNEVPVYDTATNTSTWRLLQTNELSGTSDGITEGTTNLFLTSAERTKLGSVTSGAAVASVSGTAPIVSSGGTTPAISITAATTSADGSMSAADKTKLDGITAGAAVASVTGTAPIVSSGGTSPAISITAATTSAAGSMSAADKLKLDGVTSFSTISVATQSNVVAASTTDTLTFAIAGGMSITTNATTDTITFDSKYLDFDDVTLQGPRLIEMNGETLTFFDALGDVAVIGPDSVELAEVSVRSLNAAVAGYVKFMEASNNGVNSIRVQAPTNVAADVAFTLPSADGTSGQVVQTNGSGGLSFVTKKVNSVSSITVLTGAWSLVSGVYEATISNANISATSIVDVIPNNADASTIRTAGLLPRTDSSAGAVKIYATSAPAATITVTLNIFDL